MKAIVQDKYGTADNLVLAEDRLTGGRERRGPVRVHAASVFIGDWHVVTGLPYAIRPKLELGQPKARVRGQEMAGRVADVIGIGLVIGSGSSSVRTRSTDGVSRQSRSRS